MVISFVNTRQVKGKIQELGKFHLYDKYGPWEVWEKFIFWFFGPWGSEFNFRFQLLASLKYNPVPQQFTLSVHPWYSKCTTHDLFEYTPGLGVLKEAMGCTWECAGCTLMRNWVVLKRGQKLDPEIEFWAPGGKKSKYKAFPNVTGTIFIIWVKLIRPLYLPFKQINYIAV